jgi:hypothetical protein
MFPVKLDLCPHSVSSPVSAQPSMEVVYADGIVLPSRTTFGGYEANRRVAVLRRLDL